MAHSSHSVNFAEYIHIGAVDNIWKIFPISIKYILDIDVSLLKLLAMSPLELKTKTKTNKKKPNSLEVDGIIQKCYLA